MEGDELRGHYVHRSASERAGRRRAVVFLSFRGRVGFIVQVCVFRTTEGEKRLFDPPLPGKGHRANFVKVKVNTSTGVE